MKPFNNTFQTSIDISEREGTTKRDREKLYKAIEDLINSNPKFACRNGYFPEENMNEHYTCDELNKTKYYAIFDGEDYLNSGYNCTTKEDVRDELISLMVGQGTELKERVMRGMEVEKICTFFGYSLHEQTGEPFPERD